MRESDRLTQEQFWLLLAVKMEWNEPVEFSSGHLTAFEMLHSRGLITWASMEERNSNVSCHGTKELQHVGGFVNLTEHCERLMLEAKWLLINGGYIEGDRLRK